MLTEKNRPDGVGRRTLLKGVAWATPVVAVAVTAPLAAASDPCVPTVTNLTTGIQSADGRKITLTAKAPNGQTYRVEITSSLSPVTVTANPASSGQPSETRTSYNMKLGNSGINGGESDYLFTGFGPSTAVVINQRGADPSKTSNSPVQTLTFRFFDKDDIEVNPTAMRIDVFDISSVSSSSNAGRKRYWDAVGFSVRPSRIQNLQRSARHSGAGVGTLSDPFRRSDGNLESSSSEALQERFFFGSFPSGSTMQYSSRDGRAGWQFISINGIAFAVGSC